MSTNSYEERKAITGSMFLLPLANLLGYANTYFLRYQDALKSQVICTQSIEKEKKLCIEKSFFFAVKKYPSLYSQTIHLHTLWMDFQCRSKAANHIPISSTRIDGCLQRGVCISLSIHHESCTMERPCFVFSVHFFRNFQGQIQLFNNPKHHKNRLILC